MCVCSVECTKRSLICFRGVLVPFAFDFFLCLIFPYRSAPLKASAVVMELCFLVNNDSFHSRTAFSPVAKIDGAEGKERVVVGLCCCTRQLSLHSYLL